MICSNCGSQNCQVITETSTSGKDFSASKGCCGLILLGPIGLLCGACGKGKKINTEHFFICGNCGNKFKAPKNLNNNINNINQQPMQQQYNQQPMQQQYNQQPMQQQYQDVSQQYNQPIFQYQNTTHQEYQQQFENSNQPNLYNTTEQSNEVIN